MLRVTVILLALAVIGVARVELGRQEDRMRYEVHRNLTQQVELRRRLWDQCVRIGEMLAPREVRRRRDDMALELTDENESRRRMADSGERPVNRPGD